MERILIVYLELFNRIVSFTEKSDNSLLDLDSDLIKQSDYIVEEFQKIVIQVKNEKMQYEDHVASLSKDVVPLQPPLGVKESVDRKNNTNPLKDTALNPPVRGEGGKDTSSSAKDVNNKKPGAKDNTSSPSSSQSSSSKDEKTKPIIPILPPVVVEETTVENVLKDVAEKADSLESGLKQDKFQEGQQEHGSTIETVVKVGGEGSDEKKSSDSSSASSSSSSSSSSTTSDSSSSKKPVVLIDSKNNQYVLSKPGDATAHVEDSQLMQDLLILLLVCCVGGIVMYFMGLPVFFGYIIAGTILSKNRLIENAVQVET